MNAKRIEAITQELLNTPTEETQERMEMVKQRAFQEYMSRAHNGSLKTERSAYSHARTQKGLGHRLMTACALALAILVLPVVVTMILPVPLSTADDDWGRDIVIWINDTFHTEIKVPDSLHDQGGLANMAIGESLVFHSAKEAADFLDEELLVLGSDDVPCELQSITISALGEGIYRITEEYLFGTIKVTATLKTVLSSHLISVSDETMIVKSKVAELYVWDNEGESCAICLFDDWQVLMSAPCSQGEAVRIFATLHSVN